MLQRWLVVLIGLPLLLAALLLCPDWATVIVVCGIAAAAAYELLHTAGKKVPKCVYAATILAAVALEWVIYDEHTWQFYEGYQSMGMIRILCVPLVLVTFLFFIAVKSYGKPDAMPFADVATAIVGGIVFPLMYSSIFLLRMDPEYGRMYVLLPFCVAFIGDSLSMYGGMLFGKRKMAPSVNAIGQLGDLSMSLIKREVGIKDYSHIFLTHGGMLDRFDSTLFIAPWLYLFVCAGL